MTAEVAIMNKEAIALAADSAATFQDSMKQKIFTSVSKIFTLSKYEPVGVMIYGSADFMTIPWETIIKIYRNELGHRTFKNISEYSDDFLDFLTKKQLCSDKEQEWHVRGCIYGYFDFIKKNIINTVEGIIESEGTIDETIIKKKTSQIIKEHFEQWQNAELIPSFSKDNFKQKYQDIIKKAKKDVFESLHLTQTSSRYLTMIAVDLFAKFRDGLIGSDVSGLVIAGFGTEDIYPSLESFSIECKIDNYLKYKKNEEESVKLVFPTTAAIRPFAQSEMVNGFMTGVDPNYQTIINKYIRQTCMSYPEVLVDNMNNLNKREKDTLKNDLKKVGKDICDEYLENLSNYRRKYYVDPVMSVVQVLPKDELASMAESLISLTSFKKRVSMAEETVGGPIDVAVISKGDGFVWIKRKHYFEREFNQQFFANYYKEGNTNVTNETKQGK